MNKFLIILALTAITATHAEEKFEINRKNCNLPLDEIKKLVSDVEEVKRKCAEKASSDNWMKKSLVAK